MSGRWRFNQVNMPLEVAERMPLQLTVMMRI
jgi:hypothetical protein